MIQTVRQVGGTAGLAIVGAIVAGVQSNRLEDFLLGIGAPQSEITSVQRVLAEDSGSQQQIAERVPHAELRQVPRRPRTPPSAGSQPPTGLRRRGSTRRARGVGDPPPPGRGGA